MGVLIRVIVASHPISTSWKPASPQAALQACIYSCLQNGLFILGHLPIPWSHTHLKSQRILVSVPSATCHSCSPSVCLKAQSETTSCPVHAETLRLLWLEPVKVLVSVPSFWFPKLYLSIDSDHQNCLLVFSQFHSTDTPQDVWSDSEIS